MVKAVLAHIDPVVLVGYRFILAALLVGAYLQLSHRPCWRDFRHGLFLGFILWILYVAQTVGLGITTASNSGFITGLFVVFVPLIGWTFYRERVAPRHWAAVLLALIGLWLLTGGVRGANAGDVMTLAAAVTYAIHVLYAGRCLRNGVDPWVLNFQQMLVVGLLALATAAVQGGVAGVLGPQPLAATLGAHFSVATAGAWGVLAFLTLFPTITAYVAQLFGQQVVSAARASLIFTLEPVFAALFAWTLGGERFVALSALGGGLMVLAMLVSELDWRTLLKRRAVT